ncbi:putative ankyrin repeat protein RF_0381 [Microplitis mediator]|uniref:putative ankyrin repeat protein RF_0381 n=1 Tax=Microplitis mediator TaxID=375433 RepID=UPI002553EA49|nr:putative ankyrin repeat protein RF_0381 [Microplitis mediator]
MPRCPGFIYDSLSDDLSDSTSDDPFDSDESDHSEEEESEQEFSDDLLDSASHSSDSHESDNFEEKAPEQEPKKLEDTPLISAVKEKNLELIKKILDSDVDVNETGADHKTALHVAVDVEYSPAVECLLEHGANITAGNFAVGDNPAFWNTSLHAAVEKNHLDIVQLFLTKEINATALKKHHQAALTRAVELKNDKAINFLSENSNSNVYNNSINKILKSFSMQELSELGYSEDALIMWFSKSTEINKLNKFKKTPLYLAVRNENIDMIKLLISSGADVNASNFDNETVLHAAVHSNNEEIVKLILDDELCDVNIKMDSGLTPLHIAVSKNNLKIVELLIKNNAKIDVRVNYKGMIGFAPYHVAVHEDLLDMTKYFLDTLKVDVNMRTGEDETALHVAALTKVELENYDMVELLIDRGIAVNEYSKTKYKSYTALQYALLRSNKIDVFYLLVDKKCCLNTTPEGGMTVLHRAVCKKNECIVEPILDAGADVNCQSNTTNYEDITPVLEAIRLNLKDIVVMLMNKGADINATAYNKVNKVYESAVDIAINHNGDFEMIELVLELGADINKAHKHQWTYGHISRLLKNHVTKMKIAGMVVYKKFESLIETGDFLKKCDNECAVKKFNVKCKEEIKKMKEENIENTNVSYYKLLVQNINKVDSFVEDKKIKTIMRRDELKKKFPLYGDLLLAQCRRGKILDLSSEYFKFDWC